MEVRSKVKLFKSESSGKLAMWERGESRWECLSIVGENADVVRTSRLHLTSLDCLLILSAVTKETWGLENEK